MQIAVLNEAQLGEARVALTPEYGNALRRRQRIAGETYTSRAADVECAMAVMFRIFGLIWSNA